MRRRSRADRRLRRPTGGESRWFVWRPVSFKKTKHILRAAQGLRDYVARDVITLVHLPGAVNLADILTKAQAVAVFVQLMAAYDAFLSQRARAETDAA